MSLTPLHWTINQAARRTPFAVHMAAKAAYDASESVREFHSSLPDYRPTPLVRLDALARLLGVRTVWVKDESLRLGLGAFKVLGASFAVARYLAARLGLVGAPPLAELACRVRSGLPNLTLATATDGNHGHGLAWVARELGVRAIVYVPAGCAQSRCARIEGEGAQVVRTTLSYDGAVDLAAAESTVHGWLLVQDTSWEGYEQIPNWIMQGYLTVIHEAAAQWQAVADEMPTHVLVQAGVGSFAAAVQSYLSGRWGEERPRTLVVEPLAAACLLRSAQSKDGSLQSVDGVSRTIMAGLDCGRPNPRAWEILQAHADGFLGCGDEMAALGMRMLASPVGLDPRITAGESGAVGLGVLCALMTDNRWHELARALGLNRDSSVLLFNTEGDTDPENYRRVVWNGAYPYANRASARQRIRTGGRNRIHSNH